RSGSPRPARGVPSSRRGSPTPWSPEARDHSRRRQRPAPRARGGAAYAPAGRAARHARPQGCQALVRYPALRGLHRPGRRPRGQRVHLPGGGGGRARGPDGRGARRGRLAPSAPARVRRGRRRAVRLLHVGHAADGQGDARREHEADPRRCPALPARQPLPLHGLPEDPRRGPGRCGNRAVSARPLRVVGHPVPRVDAIEKVTGRARYVTDLTLPGMAYAKVIRSPYAHARVRRVDVTRARARAGVFAALAGADLTWCDPYYGPAYRDRRVLAIEVARYEGEPVAAVAAVDEATAEEALELIDVDYEPLPAVMNLEEALAPGATLVHAGQPPAGHFADLST